MNHHVWKGDVTKPNFAVDLETWLNSLKREEHFVSDVLQHEKWVVMIATPTRRYRTITQKKRKTTPKKKTDKKK